MPQFALGRWSDARELISQEALRSFLSQLLADARRGGWWLPFLLPPLQSFERVSYFDLPTLSKNTKGKRPRDRREEEKEEREKKPDR